MTQDLRDHDHRDPVVEHQGSRGVPQIMKADPGQPGRLQESIKHI
jgi:hypothetical protein